MFGSPDYRAARTNPAPIAPDRSEAQIIKERLDGTYDYNAFEVLKKALSLSYGHYFIFFTSFVAYSWVFMLSILLTALMVGRLGLGTVISGRHLDLIIAAVILLILVVVATLFIANLVAVGIRLAAGVPVELRTLWDAGKPTPKLLLSAVLFAFIGVFLLICGILQSWLGYLLLLMLQVGWLMVIPLIIDRRLSPGQAMAASCKAIGQHWVKTTILVLLLDVLIWLPGFLMAQYIHILAMNPRSLTGVFNEGGAIAAGIYFTLRAVSLLALLIGILYQIIFGPAQMTTQQYR